MENVDNNILTKRKTWARACRDNVWTSFERFKKIALQSEALEKNIVNIYCTFNCGKARYISWRNVHVDFLWEIVVIYFTIDSMVTRLLFKRIGNISTYAGWCWIFLDLSCSNNFAILWVVSLYLINNFR